MNGLLKSRKFWLAMVALAQTVLFQFVPNFPQAVWVAIDGVISILIYSIATEDAASKSASLPQAPTAYATQATLEATANANAAQPQPK
jgi:hypothetical protein